jgi:hypothetical protein
LSPLPRQTGHRRLPSPWPSSPARSRLRIRSGHPAGERPVPAVVRRFEEHGLPELVVAAVAGDPDVSHAAAAPGRLPGRLAQARRPAHLRLAGPQLVTERTGLRLVLEQRSGHLNDHARTSYHESMITGEGARRPVRAVHQGPARRLRHLHDAGRRLGLVHALQRGDQKIIESGIANGQSSVHGRLGKPLKGLIGPNAADAINELAANQSGQPSEPRKKWWRPWSWARPRARRAAAPRGTENPPHPLRPDSRRGTGPRRPAAWPVLVIPGRLLGHIREKWPAYLRPDTPGSRETFIPRLHCFHIIT